MKYDRFGILIKIANIRSFCLTMHKRISYFTKDNNPLEEYIPLKGNLALFSTSNNIHSNLALESFIAESYDLRNINILLMWISEPCIVFGRHQNPWLECNVKESLKKGIKIVRRYSGGGCVYHDLGISLAFRQINKKKQLKNNRLFKIS
jgi:lipoate-protein ligase A